MDFHRHHRRVRPVLAAALVAGCLGASAATAAPAAAVGLPGPPPGASSGFPLPPPPGVDAPNQTGLPATTLPSASTGPGLQSGVVTLTGNTVRVKLVCQGSGTGVLRVSGFGVRGAYRCRGGRGTLAFALTGAQTGRLARAGTSIGALTLTQRGLTEHLSISLGKTTPAPDYWTSFYGLNCTAGGADTAQLVAPNFSVTPATTIDVRPWLASYTASTGWRWLGTRGPNRSSWYRWTATPNGVAQWQLNGAISPWTWGPIGVTPGHGTSVVAVFEAVYWYTHPAYVWRYVRAQPGSIPTDCVYP